MLLIALLLFCQVLEDIKPKSYGDPNSLHEMTENLIKLEEGMKNERIPITSLEDLSNDISDTKDGQLPALVPLTFPADFVGKEGTKIEEAVMTKMNKFFNASTTDHTKDIDSSEGILEHISHVDFHNTALNFIVRTCIGYLKPKESVPLDGITSRKECKKACVSQNTSILFLQHIFHKFIKQATDEDLRFRVYQNSKESYEFKLVDRGSETKHFQCRCLDNGYKVKVSPTLLKMIEDKYFNKANVGEDLADKLLQENVQEDISDTGGLSGIRQIGNIARYLGGFGGNKLRWSGDYGRPRKDPMDFILTHFIINILLFIFCHPLWYFHIVYFVIAFIAEYIL